MSTPDRARARNRRRRVRRRERDRLDAARVAESAALLCPAPSYFGVDWAVNADLKNLTASVQCDESALLASMKGAFAHLSAAFSVVASVKVGSSGKGEGHGDHG